MLIGIDPGKSGAMCVKESNGSLTFFDCPLLSTGKIDYKTLSSIVKPYKGVTAIIEDVSAYGMGVKSAFSFGANFGAWIAMCSLYDLPMVFISPKEWTKALNKPGKKVDKYAGLELARKLYPQAMPYLKRKKDQDRADALLLIHWYENYYQS